MQVPVLACPTDFGHIANWQQCPSLPSCWSGVVECILHEWLDQRARTRQLVLLLIDPLPYQVETLSEHPLDAR
jgi:hypothetical protein